MGVEENEVSEEKENTEFESDFQYDSIMRDIPQTENVALKYNQYPSEIDNLEGY